MDSSALDLSPQDRDLAVRTVLGEAGNQGDDGQLAVANVILNRTASGKYGPSVAAVVQAPGQFEPWQTKPRELMSYSPNDPAYQRAGQIVDAAASGQAPDNTGGATHFYAPKAQAALGRNAPSWSKNPTATIGAHVFSAPEGTVSRQQQNKQDAGPDVDGLLSAWGVSGAAGQGGSATPAAQAPTASAGPASGPDVDGMLSAWGVGGVGSASAPGQAATSAQADPNNPPIDPADHPLTIRPKATTKPATTAATPDQSGPPQVGDASAALGRCLVNGIPIVGPYAASGLDHVAAAARALKEDVPYSQALQEVQDFSGATVAAHPTATAWGEAGGAGLGYGALGATGVGARALGLVGDNLLMRAGAGAVTNAAIGGGDAAVRSGGDPTAIATGAGLGGLAGFAGPFAGAAIQAGANKLAPYIASFQPQTSATNALLDAIQGTGGNLDDLAARLKANPRLAIMDANPGARTIAQGLAAQDGDARNALVSAYQQRVAGAKDATTGAYDAAMGPTPDVLATLDGIKKTAADNARQGFGAALKGAGPVDLSAAIQSLDDQIRPGVGKVVSVEGGIPLSPVQQRLGQIKAMLTDGKSVLTDPARLHQIQSALRVEGDTLLSSSTGSDRLMGRAVMGARDNIVSAIDDATGGTFRPAQKQYADDMAVHDAFNKGLSIFSNRGGVNGLEDRPEYWRAFVNDASPSELEALKLGVRTSVDQQMGSVRNATLKGTGIPEIQFNADKLKAVLGDKEAAKLASRMADEHAMARTNAALFEGSQTQPRQQAKAAVAVRDLAPISAEIGLPTFAAMNGSPWTAAGLTAAALARRGVQYAGQRADVARNALQAAMVSASSGAAQDAAVNRLMAAAAGRTLPTFAQGAGQSANMLTDAGPSVYDTFYKRPTTIAGLNKLLQAAHGRQ